MVHSTRRVTASSVLAVGLFALTGCAGAQAGDVGAFAPSASLALAVTQADTSCNGVLNGQGDGPLTKTVDEVTRVGDDSWEITYTIETPRAAGDYRVRDCVFVDENGNGAYDRGEELVGAGDEKVVSVDGSLTATVTVTAAEDTTVCDRVALSSEGWTDKSNIVCTTLGEEPIPVGAIGGLGLAVLAGGGLALAQGISVRRRRRRA